MSSLFWTRGRSLAGRILPGAAERRSRRTARVLHGLDDRMLADIGLRRDQIDVAARRPDVPGWHAW